MDAKSLLKARPAKEGATDRRSWGIPVFGVWVPFFTATNAAGESHISAESLGYPVRLAKDKDGTPKFADNGRPIVRVVKEISDSVRIIRENFVAELMAYPTSVKANYPDQYAAQVAVASTKGQAMADKDMAVLKAYIAANTPAEAPTGAVSEGEKVLAAA